MLGIDNRLVSHTARPWIMVAVGAGLVSIAANVGLIVLIGQAIDQAIAQSIAQAIAQSIAQSIDQAVSGAIELRALLPGLGIVLAIKITAAGLERHAADRAASTTRLTVRQDIYAHALALGPGLLDRQRTGALANTATEGLQWLEELLGRYWVRFILGMATPPLLVAFIATIDWVTAAALLVSIPLTPGFLGLVQRRFRSVSERYFAAENRLSSQFLDSIQGLTTLKLYNRGRAQGEALHRDSEVLRRDTMRLLAVNQLALFVVDWGFALGTTVVAAAVAVLRLQAEAISPGQGVALVLLSIELTRPLNLIGAFFFAGAVGRAVAKEVCAFLDIAPATAATATAATATATSPAAAGQGPVAAGDQVASSTRIAFDRVGFAYDQGTRPALDRVSFTVNAGQTTALVGPSGAGKTSVINLLLRLYEPREGEIRLGGRPLASWPVAELRAQLALVPQDPYIFYGTVADNLRVAKADARAAEIEQASRAAHIHDFIAGLPHGYDTVIGERGLSLSGGQAQRLAIARAVLKDAPIILLDEPTAHVDSATEDAIRAALEELTRNRTVLLIAHRLSTVRRADRVLVMDSGRIVESGTHTSLMQQEGIYAQLVRAQMHLHKEGA